MFNWLVGNWYWQPLAVGRVDLFEMDHNRCFYYLLVWKLSESAFSKFIEHGGGETFEAVPWTSQQFHASVSGAKVRSRWTSESTTLLHGEASEHKSCPAYRSTCVPVTLWNVMSITFTAFVEFWHGSGCWLRKSTILESKFYYDKLFDEPSKSSIRIQNENVWQNQNIILKNYCDPANSRHKYSLRRNV